MATRTFSLNTEPHQAIIGDVTLLFIPETEGAAFADAYASLRTAQEGIKAAGDNIGADELRAVSAGMRAFVGNFLLPDSVPDFESLRLPERVLVQLLEYVAELYGGGSGAEGKTGAPGGRSSGSSRPSKTTGKSGSGT